MKRVLRLAYLSCLASLPILPATWSGWLVNSRCYSSLEANRSDLPSYVNWGQMGAIRYCSPDHKTTSFAVIDHNGLSLRLDAEGNERAMSQLRNTEKRTLATAEIERQPSHNKISVSRISVAKHGR